MKYLCPDSSVLARGDEQYPVIDGIVECPADLAQEMQLAEAPAAPPAADAHPLHSLNAEDAKAFVATLDTEEAIAAALEAESAHPKNLGGRKSVLAALQARVDALAAQ